MSRAAAASLDAGGEILLKLPLFGGKRLVVVQNI